MSIQLTTPWSKTNLAGEVETVENVKVSAFKASENGDVSIAVVDSATGKVVGAPIGINAPAAVGNIIDMIENYLIAQNIVVGTKD